MPDLWSTLIEVVERYWKEKPRKDTLEALISLRAEMIACQHWYDSYTALKKQGDVDELVHAQFEEAKKTGLRLPPHPGVEWIRSLTEIGDALVKLDSVLKIFSAEAHERIERYRCVESLEAGAEGMLGIPQRSWGSVRVLIFAGTSSRPPLRPRSRNSMHS